MSSNNAIREGTPLDKFTFWKSYLQAIERCPKKAQLELYKALANFCILGKEPSGFSDKMAELAWIGMYNIARKGRINAFNKMLNDSDLINNEPETKLKRN